MDADDPDLDAPEWEIDADGDGYGDAGQSRSSCEQPDGYVAAGGEQDCDDDDPAVNPAAQEVCGGGDEDCDGLVDDADSSLSGERSTWLRDEDGDGYGDPDSAEIACEQPDDTVPAGGLVDCDDGDASALGCLDLGAGAALEGTGSYIEAGAAVAGAGDVDGDGSADLLVGGPGGAGAAWLVYGPVTAGGPLATLGVPLRGSDSGDEAGATLAGLGDLNGDGLDDVAVGAWGAAGDAGLVAVLYGPVSEVNLAEAPDRVEGHVAGDRVGTAVVGSEDLTGDGLADMVVGGPGESSLIADAGAAWVVAGPVTGNQTLGTSPARFRGDSAERLGSSLAALGDVDGDGFADLALGAPESGDDYHGEAYVFLGPLSGAASSADADAAWVGQDSGGRAASALAAAGDVDGDGLPDLAVGQQRIGSDSGGVVWVVSEPWRFGGALDDAPGAVRGEGSDGLWRADGLGDLNGDGFGELLVGAPGRERGGANVIYVPITGTVYAADLYPAIAGEDSGDLLGYAVAGVGDADGDGTPDLLVGAPGADPSGVESGAVWLLSAGAFQ